MRFDVVRLHAQPCQITVFAAQLVSNFLQNRPKRFPVQRCRRALITFYWIQDRDPGMDTSFYVLPGASQQFKHNPSNPGLMWSQAGVWYIGYMNSDVCGDLHKLFRSNSGNCACVRHARGYVRLRGAWGAGDGARATWAHRMAEVWRLCGASRWRTSLLSSSSTIRETTSSRNGSSDMACRPSTTDPLVLAFEMALQLPYRVLSV